MADHPIIIAELEAYVVPDVRPTGVELGRGAYGIVEEVEIPGAVSAAKRIHEELLRYDSPEDERRMTSTFANGCKLLITLRHPHIVQFLGICYLPGAKMPALVIERLMTNLHNLLENHSNIPLAMKRSILLGIARGLVYLHSQSPPIIHRDLTARNVLLNSAMETKIADVGMSHMVNIQPGPLASPMTVYLPPEILESGAKDNTSFDVFSFGNVALFTLTQVFPELKVATYTESKPSELERRVDYIKIICKQLGGDHPLLLLVMQCLENNPSDRPTTAKVLADLDAAAVSDTSLGESKNKLELIREMEEINTENEKLQAELSSTKNRLEAEVCNVRDQLEAELHKTRKSLKAKLRTSKDQLETGLFIKQKLIETMHEQAESKNQQLRSLQCGLRAQGEESRRREQDMVRMSISEHKSTTPKVDGGLCFPVSFEWKKGKPLPNGMAGMDSVILNGRAFITDGDEVLPFNIESEEWEESLSKPPVKRFSFAKVNGQLVAVGGTERSTEVLSNKILTWDSDTFKWVERYPPMPTARQDSAAIGYKHYLVVTGGSTDGSSSSSTKVVEVLDSSSSLWFTAQPLPYTLHCHTSVLVGDSMYLLSGLRDFVTNASKTVVSASLPALISHASQRKGNVSIWEELPESPLFFSTPFTIGNALFTAGGTSSTNTYRFLEVLGVMNCYPCSDIYLYNPAIKEWVKVGAIPVPCWDCACIVLPSQKLIVVGGNIIIATSQSFLKDVNIANIHLYL